MNIFKNLDQNNRGYLVPSDFVRVFGNNYAAEQAFQVMTLQHLRSVSAYPSIYDHRLGAGGGDASTDPEMPSEEGNARQTITKAELRQVLRTFYRDRANLAKSLNNFQNLTVVSSERASNASGCSYVCILGILGIGIVYR